MRYRLKHNIINFLLLLGSVVLAIFMFIAVYGTKPARAHNPISHVADDLAEAYSEAYGKCCVGFEYENLRIEEWEPTENGWRIHWKGQWLDVPRSAKVKNLPNPDGIAKAWVFGSGDNAYVRCFMAGTLM